MAKQFSDKFWQGKRWVVLRGGRPLGRGRGFYEHYSDAAGFCDKAGRSRSHCKVQVLSTWLKRKNGVVKPVKDDDMLRLKEAMRRYPLRLFRSCGDWEKELINGHYYPMLWRQPTRLLLAVKTYVIVSYHESRRLRGREVFSSDQFARAMKEFRRYSKKMMCKGVRYCLLGRLKEGSIRYNEGGLWGENETVLFYQAHHGQHGDPEILQVQDPCTPIDRTFTLFARYRPEKAMFSFYDGRLKRIRPGDKPEDMNFDHFDF